MPDYLPGQCNIGSDEIRRRRKAGTFFAVVSILLFAFLVVTDAPHASRLLLFFPLVVAVIGWVQARRGFCIAFGLLGAFNFGSIGSGSRVRDSANRRQDQVTALKLFGRSALIALLATLILTVIPL